MSDEEQLSYEEARDQLVEVVRQADAPVILETPTTEVTHADQIAWLRAHL